MARRNDQIEAEWSAYSQRFATSLRSARERAGLSQEDVAHRAGLTRYTYQKYEKGESRPGNPANPTLRTLLALAQVLELPLTSLIPSDVPDLRAR
ncbi:helix-turn-helix transcriptional regulator [Microbacterium azadirachtae]|uniref:helix-turn-helix transcriptional regulator n=1 Tax=Microbacterium azadirachtae TaxID=582680 RepID=UPI00087F7806|nr:helix-turn-helix transcriptional regulator [Microbacterium azadirachtae]SDL91564.1 DNA-binding transcriptional regulator, XRE-family HTH domain [Microbacterium azadirachtae]SEG16286.1 DNA-binding transcriptional regulator, XRE-family HTH domain [Microbacterium azadirachtae]SEG18786.1 DNA-binding transcriptional regulator, XRE-family HTH domain [Microbacterium azadirachtae]